MKRSVLFIHGGGEGGYQADKKLVASLQSIVGSQYKINYPKLSSDESAPDFGWTAQVGSRLLAVEGEVILVGHSFGASIISKYLSENKTDINIAGIFLIATPFWQGEEDWQKPLQLKEDFARQLPAQVPVFFYHCQDDVEIPFSHFEKYRRSIPAANFRALNDSGHQLNNDLTLVANDIKSL